MLKEELDGASRFEHPSLRSEFQATQILNAAGSIFHTNPEGLRSGAHGKDAVHARWVAAYVMQEGMKVSVVWISHFIHQHHTTVMYGLQKINDAIRRGSSLLQNANLVRAMYRNMPGERLITVRQPDVPLARIIGVVATLLDLKPDDIYRESNARRIVFSRQVATYLLRQIGGWSIAAIAQHFSQETTTARYSYRTIIAAMKRDPSVRYLVNEARARCLCDSDIK